MKKLIIILLTIVSILFSNFGISQTIDCRIFKDGVVMKDGKVYTFDKNGAMILLEGDKTLSNGTIVTKTGDCKSSSGAKSKLRNGEALTAKGELMVLAEAIFQVEGALMKDGKVWLVNEGIPAEVTAATPFGSGLNANTDGSITLKDGSIIILKEGEFVSFSGEYMQRKENVFIVDGVSIRGGKAMKWEQGKFVPVTADVALGKSGAKVNSSGVVTAKDGSKTALSEGAMISSNGDLAFAKNDLISDGVFKRDGKMMVLKAGMISSLTEDYVLSNGNTVSVNGMLNYSKSDKLELREGEMVLASGALILLKAGNIDSKAVGERKTSDHYIFRSGKMMFVKEGEPQILLQDVTFPNGAKLLKHGHVTKKDGAKHILKEGEKLDIDGNFIIDKSKSDYDEKNHLVLKQGKVMQIKDGKELPLMSEVLMPDWSKIYPDGTLEKQNGAKVKMKEGERFNMEGEPMTAILVKSGAPVTAVASNAKTPPVATTTSSTSTSTTLVTMKAGKLIILMGAKEIPVTKERILTNGTKIALDGTITPKAGAAFMLKEGDKVDYNTGVLVK